MHFKAIIANFSLLNVLVHIAKKCIFALLFKELKMITVTEKAKSKAISLIAAENKPAGAFIRVGVDGGGCSGLTYKLEFDTEIRPDDKIFEDKGIKIVCDRKSFLYLIGTELDFSDGLNGKGFQFNNPNASRTCGCGESFAV
jgi:iron-sulfur cluster assembly protein